MGVSPLVGTQVLRRVSEQRLDFSGEDCFICPFPWYKACHLKMTLSRGSRAVSKMTEDEHRERVPLVRTGLPWSLS